MERRGVLRAFATALAGTAAGVIGTSGIETYQHEHPAPTDRVSPLVQNRTVHSPTRIIWRGDAQQRRVALTFDDGPDPRWTPMALELLARHRARATFFMLGSAVAQHPDMARAWLRPAARSATTAGTTST